MLDIPIHSLPLLSRFLFYSNSLVDVNVEVEIEDEKTSGFEGIVVIESVLRKGNFFVYTSDILSVVMSLGRFQ